MLVLSRKKNETIVIDDIAEIEVLKIQGKTVRLGIKAPSTVKILRGELSPFEIKSLSPKSASELSAGNDSEEINLLPNPFVAVFTN